MDEQERQALYNASLTAALAEYQDVSTQARKLGLRLKGLRQAINGLSILVGQGDNRINSDNYVHVLTPEGRLESMRLRGR